MVLIIMAIHLVAWLLINRLWFTLLKKDVSALLTRIMLRSHRRQRPLTDNKEKPQPHSFGKHGARSRLCQYFIVYYGQFTYCMYLL